MKKLCFVLLTAFSALCALEEEDLIWKEGPSVQEYNSALHQAIAIGDWWKVIDFASIISYNFPTSPFAQEISYIMGEAYYKLDQLEYANEAFTEYLNHSSAPKHFEEAIEYKFNIAERLASGEKKRLFGSPKMPAWVPARADSIEIFDEVIAALPHSELAIRSLLSKARVQSLEEDYKPSLETLDLLIRRFPKHELAAAAYLEKEKVYLMQCQAKNLDPDVLDMAEVNLRKFHLAFPREARLAEGDKIYSEMQEIFAQNLLETGAFFEKTKKVPAALIYYNKVIAKYPKTKAAAASLEKLSVLQPSSSR
ncbi:MAG: outer membrane protein assembly factor BamD [Verrucomicrobia bacterium]|nr:outer membrane protein assembly factor BamD [Verrucomicrobiota bacterium]MBU6446160.1 outer membrane protein assembly factor BamD [Verrucomicrobiota bacterium]MDE3047105.1 outer membrane protein assembly factor BamD [Verrucomicrobiota bacterium]